MTPRYFEDKSKPTAALPSGTGPRCGRRSSVRDTALERAFAEDDGVVVAGPLCTGLDVFPGGLDRVPEVGDLVAILDLGAYGYTDTMSLFLSHPSPAELATRNGHVMPDRSTQE